MLNFIDIFSEYVADNKKVWQHDRNESLGASETFSCIRKAWFKRFGEERGFPPDPDYEESWGAMERGNVMEDHWVVPALLHGTPKGSEYLYSGKNQVTFVYGRNSATPDGLLTNLPKDALAEYGVPDIESDCVMIEIKSIDPRVNLDEEKAVHFGQVQVQMGIMRRMTEFKPMYAVIIYIDASFYDDILVFPVRYEPAQWKAAKARAKRLFEAVGPSELTPEGKVTDECKYCNFRHSCAKVNGAEIPTNTEQDDVVVAALMEDFKGDAVKREDIKNEIKALEKELEDTNIGIKKMLKAADSRKVNAGEYRFSWIFLEGRETVDVKEAEKAGIDLAPFKKRGPGYDKLTVNRIKSKQEKSNE